MNFDNYIFDFDGTLADTTSCHVYATQEAFKNLELEIPSEEEIIKVMNQPLEEGFKYLVNKDVTKAQVETFIQAYHQYYDRYEVHHLKEYAGISEMLQLLHNKKKKLFVVSSKKTDVVTKHLNYLGLYRFMTDALGLHSREHLKPHHETLQTLIQNNHLNSGRTVYIGDTIYDVKSANASNIKSCVVTWGAQSAHDLLQENPHYVVNEPEEIITIL
ncbi:HAD family hydrolase [Staphylococcus sp. HMSC036D05]|uniref:HAD family hydrolase n=1 Tax=Staphylococcus sp. HMSC036D05 TaxID=1715059 RepID=UPI0008AA3C62|nr:HAD family hydrolase [Staphylococcus sp. HMSC036D05]OHO68299.1 HAD family hydrolase [Staphylococcus sp. HMSC036D05]